MPTTEGLQLSKLGEIKTEIGRYLQIFFAKLCIYNSEGA
jgi:hypothetical protein